MRAGNPLMAELRTLAAGVAPPTGHGSHSPVMTIIILAVILVVGSVIVWGYFSRRGR